MFHVFPVFAITSGTKSMPLMAPQGGDTMLLLYTSAGICNYARDAFLTVTDDLHAMQIDNRDAFLDVLNNAKQRGANIVAWELMPPIPGLAPPAASHFEPIADCIAKCASPERN